MGGDEAIIEGVYVWTSLVIEHAKNSPWLDDMKNIIYAALHEDALNVAFAKIINTCLINSVTIML